MRSWFRGALLAMTLTLVAGTDARAQIKQVVFNEVLIRRSGGSPNVDQLVELKNTGIGSINIGGWAFCHQLSYVNIPGGTSIPGGGLLTVHFNQSGVNTATDVYIAGEVLSTTSDLGLYINDNNFASAANMHAFVQWGGVPNGRQSVAAQAGLWTTNAFVPNPAIGQSVELCGTGDATLVTSWIATGSPTIGAANGCGVAVMPVSWGSVKSLFNQFQSGRRYR